ncbi:MAG: helix-turn-helix domain-containing protein [Streptosporangiaceae bacterium]
MRTARLRRGTTQIALAELAYVSSSFISMVETGERELTRVCDIVVLVGILRVSALYLSDGRLDASLTAQRPARTAPFPAGGDPARWPITSSWARQFIHLARRDGRAAGEWLHRVAREPSVHPWLVLDQLATRLGDEPTMTRMPSPARSPCLPGLRAWAWAVLPSGQSGQDRHRPGGTHPAAHL